MALPPGKPFPHNPKTTKGPFDKTSSLGAICVDLLLVWRELQAQCVHGPYNAAVPRTHTPS